MKVPGKRNKKDVAAGCSHISSHVHLSLFLCTFSHCQLKEVHLKLICPSVSTSVSIVGIIIDFGINSYYDCTHTMRIINSEFQNTNSIVFSRITFDSSGGAGLVPILSVIIVLVSRSRCVGNYI